MRGIDCTLIDVQPKNDLILWHKLFLLRCSSTADRPRAASVNFFLQRATSFVRWDLGAIVCLVMLVSNTSSAASEKPTVCLFSGFNPEPPAEFTRGAQAVSSSCHRQRQQQQRQQNSQIYCNILKKLPPRIWISPGEEITSLQDAAERRMWIDNRQLNLISTIL